ncbi:MAG TPA: hypothetical protein VMM12_05925 [Longimicrobiales bacterium]|nr:hypothetical protein [Longimicrobiales bacterium]
MYYMLGCFGPEDEDRAAIGEILNTDVNWQTGTRFKQAPPVPVRVQLNPDFPGIMVPMFDSGILLFEDTMLGALGEAGVDNLDLYDAVIEDPVSGQIFNNYRAVNIIGAVASADLEKSTFEAPSGTPIIDTDFDSLEIDPERPGGLLMFRLAESVNGIVVHEHVRLHLERSAIRYLDFTEPAEWVG